MDTVYPFAFEAPIVWHDVGSDRYAYRVVWLDRALHADLPLERHPRLRIEGELGDQPFEAALTPVRGGWYILLSKARMEAAGLGMGDRVEVRFAIGDQDAVEVPPALTAALAEDAEAAGLWDAASPGRRRGLAHLVASAKTDPTRAKRVALVFGVLRGTHDMRGRPV